MKHWILFSDGTLEWTRNSKSLNSNKFSASISHNHPQRTEYVSEWSLLSRLPRVGFAGYYEEHQSKGSCAASPLTNSTRISSLWCDFWNCPPPKADGQHSQISTPCTIIREPQQRTERVRQQGGFQGQHLCSAYDATGVGCSAAQTMVLGVFSKPDERTRQPVTQGEKSRIYERSFA